MKKLTLKRIGAGLLSVLFMALVILPAIQVGAQGTDDPLNIKNVDVGLTANDTSPVTLVTDLVKIVLGLMGLVAVIIVLYAGFIWMTAQGDEDKVKKAKDMLKNGVIGLIIIVLAYTLASWASEFAVSLTGSTPGGPLTE